MTYDKLVAALREARALAEQMDDDLDMGDVLDHIDDAITAAGQAPGIDHEAQARDDAAELRFEMSREVNA